MGMKRKAKAGPNYQNHNSIELKPRNQKQHEYIIQLTDFRKHIVFGIGPAGTGKTLLAVKAAIKSFKEKEVDKIILVVAPQEDRIKRVMLIRNKVCKATIGM